MRNTLTRLLAVLLLLLFWIQPSGADNTCWHGSDYSTNTASGHEDSKVIVGTGGAIATYMPGRVCQLTVTNNSASTVWAMTFDSATLPANTTKPKLEFNVPATSSITNYGYGVLMSSGIVVACSSTEGQLTVTTTTACNFHITIAH